MQHQIVRQTVGELAYGGIKNTDSIVIALPGDINPIFSSLKLVLEIKEILIRLEVRLSFHYYHKL